MLIERDLRELSNVSSHQFSDRSAKWLLRQREHLEALVRIVGGEIADALDFETEIVNMAESIIEISEQRGLQQGIEQGIEQGETRGKQAALLKVLEHRFQRVPESVITRVRALQNPVELDALFEKSLTAESLEELQ